MMFLFRRYDTPKHDVYVRSHSWFEARKFAIADLGATSFDQVETFGEVEESDVTSDDRVLEVTKHGSAAGSFNDLHCECHVVARGWGEPEPDPPALPELPKVRVHELKTWPEFHEKLRTREKTFEFRKYDRDFQVGDFLLLKEWDRGSIPENHRGGFYTEERPVVTEVTFIMNVFMTSGHHVIMGMEFHEFDDEHDLPWLNDNLVEPQTPSFNGVPKSNFLATP